MKKEQKKVEPSKEREQFSCACEAHVAKLNFEIRHNDYRRIIKEGESVSDVPEIYHVNLRTEGVL